MEMGCCEYTNCRDGGGWGVAGATMVSRDGVLSQMPLETLGQQVQGAAKMQIPLGGQDTCSLTDRCPGGPAAPD